MKKNILLVFSICIANLLAGQNTIKYSYDRGGNLTQRSIQIVNLNLRLAKKTFPKDSVLSFKVFPNPTDEYITISGVLPNNATHVDVYIYNIEGMLVKKDTYNAIEKKIRVSDLTSGVYFLTIKYAEKKESSYKLIIQH